MGDLDEDARCYTFGNLNATELEEIYSFYENFTSKDCNCTRIIDTWHAVSWIYQFKLKEGTMIPISE